MSYRDFYALLTGLVLAALTVATTAPANAQGVTTPKRIALVIGNSAYAKVTRLTNPANDATDIAAKLKILEFEVILATNATHAQMSTLIAEFRSKVTRNHVALVFYAGHGVTVNTQSFLLPVDTPQAIEVTDQGQPIADAVNKQLINMASVLEPLEASKIGIVFLDACRNNAADTTLGMNLRMVSLGQARSVPIVRGTGTLEIKPSPYSAGVFRAYATQLNNVASDGAGRNSPFTKALLKWIDKPGTIQDLMIKVRKEVMQETKNEQIPWEEAALNEPFFFLPQPATTTVTPTGGTKTQNTGGQAKTAPPKRNTLPPNLGVGIGTGM